MCYLLFLACFLTPLWTSSKSCGPISFFALLSRSFSSSIPLPVSPFQFAASSSCHCLLCLSRSFPVPVPGNHFSGVSFLQLFCLQFPLQFYLFFIICIHLYIVALYIVLIYRVKGIQTPVLVERLHFDISLIHTEIFQSFNNGFQSVPLTSTQYF